MQIQRVRLGSALAAMVLLVVGSAFADAIGPTVNSVSQTHTAGPGGMGLGDSEFHAGWSGASAYSVTSAQVQHPGSDELYGFNVECGSHVTTNGDLKAYSKATGDGVFDLSYSSTSLAEYHKYLRIQSDDVSTNRATVRVTISFDGSLEAVGGVGAADPDKFATSSASAGIRALATYWNTSGPGDEEGYFGPSPVDGAGGGIIINPPTPNWEAWAEGAAGVRVENGVFSTYARGELYEAGALNWVTHGSFDGESMGIAGTVDSTAVFEFTVDDLTQIVDLEVILSSSASITGHGGSIAGGNNDSTYFSHRAYSDFWNTGTFEIESVYDPDNPSAAISVTTVPEPATLGLLALGSLALMRRCRGA